MVNTLRHHEIENQDLSWLDFNQPEFQELKELAAQFCAQPGLWEWISKFENQLTNMTFIDIFELYTDRHDMLPWHDIETTNLRARQIEKALFDHIDENGIHSDELIQLGISVKQMDNIYKELKKNHIH